MVRLRQKPCSPVPNVSVASCRPRGWDASMERCEVSWGWKVAPKEKSNRKLQES